MALTLKEEDAADWVYRGEGAVNLVLAYAGSSPSFIGKVISLRKAPKNGLESNGVSMHILVTREFLELVEKNVTGQRPVWRVDAARVDTECDFGLLMSDHSLFLMVMICDLASTC
ncbi:hypothetical protein V8G54_035695 [Vigna mungo]|uniref:Inositol-pentakisphosphate 2-kinase n=1 Tax=Vigna mungo TaxID=3915 RepID=A0AAQ3MFE0_VIGMU